MPSNWAERRGISYSGYADLAGKPEVLELIGLSPVSVDEVLRRCHLTAPELQSVLTELELEGRVARLPGGLFQRLGRA